VTGVAGTENLAMSGELPTSIFEKSRFAMARVAKVLQRDPLLFACCAGILGIVLADRGSFPGIVGAGVALILLTWVGWLSKWRGWQLLAGCLIGMIAFGLLHWNRLEEIRSFPLEKAVLKSGGLEIVGEGWIADEPEFREGAVSTLIRLTSIEFRGHTLESDHLLPTWIQQTPEGLSYGRPIRFVGVLRPLEGRRAPGGFDPSAFYFRDSGSLARLEIRAGDSLEILDGNEGSRLIEFAQRSRRKMESALRIGLGQDDSRYAKLIAAMSLGIRENTPEDLQELFRLSGTMHLFAVSGMHVAVVGGILLWVALLFRIPRRWAVLIAIPLILFYAVLTGLRPSAIRAAVMLSVFLVGYAVREKPRLLNSLGVAGIVILAFDTQQLFLPGFQLSFLVLLFIAIFVSGLRLLLAKPFLPDPFIPRNFLSAPRRAVDVFVGATATLLAISIASWLGSAGLLTWHFQSLAPVGVIANLFMVPLAGIVIGLAAFSLVCSGVNFVWLAAVANKLTVGMAIILTSLAQFFSDLPGAHRHTGELSGGQSQNSLVVDVMGERGEGAVLMTLAESSGRQTNWMIDSGGNYSYRRSVLPTLRSRGVNRLDAIILTHGDSGHIGAAPELLQLLQPRVLIESVAKNRSPVYPDIIATADDLGIERIRVERGQRITLGGDIAARILAPALEGDSRLADDRSLVLKLEYKGWKILFTSDAGFETEKSLLQAEVDVSSDVWIRGQHKNSPSGLPGFVDAISPGAVISSHADFPETEAISEELREHLKKIGSALFDTDSGGVVTIEITDDQLVIVPFANREASLVLKKE